jgi:hypothetical protein
VLRVSFLLATQYTQKFLLQLRLSPINRLSRHPLVLSRSPTSATLSPLFGRSSDVGNHPPQLVLDRPQLNHSTEEAKIVPTGISHFENSPHLLELFRVTELRDVSLQRILLLPQVGECLLKFVVLAEQHELHARIREKLLAGAVEYHWLVSVLLLLFLESRLFEFLFFDSLGFADVLLQLTGRFAHN